MKCIKGLIVLLLGIMVFGFLHLYLNMEKLDERLGFVENYLIEPYFEGKSNGKA